MINILHGFLAIFLLFSPLVYAKDDDPFTNKFYNPLLIATQKNLLTDIISLINKGYSINTRENNITPLLMASYNNNLEIVKYIVEKDVDINSANSQGNTPLHMAYKYPQIIDILIQHGADPFKKNKYNKNAIELMFENNDKDAIQVLLKHRVLDSLNTTERNNLLNLTTSTSIKRILAPNNEQSSTYVLAKEDLIELPSGSNILVTSNVYKDKKITTTIKELPKTSFITTEKVASTQQNHLALAENNTKNNDKISNITKPLPLTQQNMVKKSTMKETMNVSSQNQSFNKDLNIFDKNNNSLWVEVKLLDISKINIINNILRQNTTYPIRIQIMKSIYDDNNLISVRAGPIYSFNTASKLCKLTYHISNVCIITDKLSVQSF